MKYSAIVIDDERLARLTLIRDLEKFPEITVAGEASGIASAMELISKTNPDLLFLDIQLDDGSGFDLLNQADFSGRVIFTTAYDEYAIRAFEVNAVDYLMKPVSVSRLADAIRKLDEGKSAEPADRGKKLTYEDRLMVMHRKSVNFIKVSSIIYVKASRQYSNIYTREGKEYLTSRTLGEWESRLPEQNFCRIHRSIIINFDFIEKIDYSVSGTAEIKITGLPDKLPVSRNYFRHIRHRYGA